MLTCPPGKSKPSRSGTSPETVGSAAPTMSTCPERTRRIASGPWTLASGWLLRLNSTRPLLLFGTPSLSIGTSTVRYCGRVGESCVTADTVTFGPGGSCCASAAIPKLNSRKTGRAVLIGVGSRVRASASPDAGVADPAQKVPRPGRASIRPLPNRGLRTGGRVLFWRYCPRRTIDASVDRFSFPATRASVFQIAALGRGLGSGTRGREPIS